MLPIRWMLWAGRGMSSTMPLLCLLLNTPYNHVKPTYSSTGIAHFDFDHFLCQWLKLTLWSMHGSFYRAMHFSAKRSIAIACRLSVTLVNCDHIGWNSSKIISSLVSLGCSLFATPTWRVCSKGNTPKFGPKVTHPRWFERRRHSIANCGRMVTDSATVTMESL